MLFIVIVMVVILAIAGVTLAYVAYPHHGDSLPGPARRVGEMLARVSDATPTIDDGSRHDDGVREHGKVDLFD